MHWKQQTGQGIMEQAREKARETQDNPDAPNYIEDARNKTKAEILNECPYFYQLEPVMLGRPSAGYVVTEETRDGQPVDNRSIRSEDLEERAEKHLTRSPNGPPLAHSGLGSDDNLIPPVLELDSTQQDVEELSQQNAPPASQRSAMIRLRKCLSRTLRTLVSPQTGPLLIERFSGPLGNLLRTTPRVVLQFHKAQMHTILRIGLLNHHCLKNKKRMQSK
ncbi:hypothetical protein PTTG_30306 [Puccinia triticina 1-1 BBBD Race 1]|uniref:Uncharacterized protein n=1 Tax=Puccinia triticina (isolate 1-1 / race 1 (BBBD)) TaxID=630390 RepID=A0A180FZL5_PUCT1|nr:hypothetical protein PTTG_30306 [Puccinia triticina 1-1 BBBD Race 1]